MGLALNLFPISQSIYVPNKGKTFAFGSIFKFNKKTVYAVTEVINSCELLPVGLTQIAWILQSKEKIFIINSCQNAFITQQKVWKSTNSEISHTIRPSRNCRSNNFVILRGCRVQKTALMGDHQDVCDSNSQYSTTPRWEGGRVVVVYIYQFESIFTVTFSNEFPCTPNLVNEWMNHDSLNERVT